LQAWEVTAEDVDRVVGAMAADGKAAAIRREQCALFGSRLEVTTVAPCGGVVRALGVTQPSRCRAR
jgi:hypothetical protein